MFKLFSFGNVKCVCVLAKVYIFVMIVEEQQYIKLSIIIHIFKV